MNLFPIIITSDERKGGSNNASHNALYVRIWSGAKDFWAVRAQEIYEWRFITLRGLVLAIPATVAPFFLGIDTAYAVIAAAFAYVLAQSIVRIFAGFWTREMELMGKTIEALVAARDYDATFSTRLLLEAASLKSYRQFKGWSFPKIHREMLDRVPKAQKWVDLYPPAPHP